MEVTVDTFTPHQGAKAKSKGYDKAHSESALCVDASKRNSFAYRVGIVVAWPLLKAKGVVKHFMGK